MNVKINIENNITIATAYAYCFYAIQDKNDKNLY